MDKTQEAAHTPGPIRGFLANGAWMVLVHTKKCARNRRRVTTGERARSMVPNRGNQFAVAMRDREDARAAIAKATGAAAPTAPSLALTAFIQDVEAAEGKATGAAA